MCTKIRLTFTLVLSGQGHHHFSGELVDTVDIAGKQRHWPKFRHLKGNRYTSKGWDCQNAFCFPNGSKLFPFRVDPLCAGKQAKQGNKWILKVVSLVKNGRKSTKCSQSSPLCMCFRTPFNSNCINFTCQEICIQQGEDRDEKDIQISFFFFFFWFFY